MVGLTKSVISQISKADNKEIERIITKNKIIPIDNLQKNKRYSVKDSRKIISEIMGKNIESKKKTMVFYNFKGGVGKTSFCFQIASHLALMGFKVLAIDTDPQGHLTRSFGFSNENIDLTLYDVICNNISPSDVIVNVYEGLDLVPSNLSLTRAESNLNERPRREERIKMAFEPYKDNYDFIAIDTNPSISHLNRNAIVFADMLNIVVETQAYALDGLKMLMSDLDEFYESMLIQKPEIIIIPNKYDEKTTISMEAVTVLDQYFKEFVLNNFAFRKSEEINTSAKTAQPLAFFCRKNSVAMEDLVGVLYYILSKTTSLEA